MSIKIIKLSPKNEAEINQVANIWLDWWGKDCNLKISDLEQIVKNRCSGKIIPITYVAKIDSQVVGTISFIDNDAELRPDLYPMIACLYVRKEYRNQGIATKLIETVLNNISSHFNVVYLTTSLDHFYEKFGFKYLETTAVNIVNGTPHSEKVYKLEIEEVLLRNPAVSHAEMPRRFSKRVRSYGEPRRSRAENRASSVFLRRRPRRVHEANED